MADSTRKLNIWINGKEVENQVASITKGMNQLRNELAHMTIGSKEYIEQTKKIQTLKGVLDEHKKMQGQIVTGWQKTKAQIMTIAAGNFISNAFTNIGATISNEFSKAITKIKEFATGISELKALTGLSGEKLETLKTNAKNLAAEFGTSAKEIVEGMKLVGSARPELLGDAEALSEMTRQTLILSKASGMDMAQSTQALAGSLNQLNEPASKAGEYINILAAAAKNGVQEIPFLSDFVLRSGKIAKDANLSFSDLATAGELLGVSFKSPELASSGLNRVLLNLQKEGLGFGSGKFSLSDALNDVKSNLDNMTDGSQKAAYQSKIFGEGLTVGKVLLENNAKNLDTNTTKFEDFRKSIEGTHEAIKQANDRMDNWQGDLDKAAGAWDRFILSLDSGNGIITQITRNVTQMFTGFLSDISTANDGSKTFVERTMGWIDTLARANPALYAFNEKIKDFFGINEKLAKIKFNRDLADAKERGTKAAQEEYKAQEDEKKKQAAEKSGASGSKVLSNDEKESASKKRQAEIKKQADNEKKALDDYAKNYASTQKAILDVRKKLNLEGLTEEEKAVQEIRDKYNEQLGVVDGFLAELEKKQVTKAGLNAEELNLLGKFYDQKLQLIGLEESEIANKTAEFDKKKLESKQKLQAQIEDITSSDYDRELKATTKKYEELIAEAEKYGLDTYNLYEKMIQDIDALREGVAPEDKDIFGMTKSDWEDIGKKFEKISMYAGGARNAIGAFFDFQSQKDAAYMQGFEQNTEKKKALLDEQLKKGVISQEKHDSQIAALDKKLENEKKRIAIDDAKRNKRVRYFDTVMNTAAAIIGFLANPGGIPGIAMSVMAGITGGIQLATIAKEPIPKAAKGMRVNKPTILQAGEAGREIILSNSIVDSPTLGPIADDLASIQEGKQPRFLGKPRTPNYKGMDAAIGRSTVQSVQNTNTTIVNQVDNTAISQMSEKIEQFGQNLDKYAKSMDNIKYLRAVITNDDIKENDKDEKFRMKYSKF